VNEAVARLFQALSVLAQAHASSASPDPMLDPKFRFAPLEGWPPTPGAPLPAFARLTLPGNLDFSPPPLNPFFAQPDRNQGAGMFGWPGKPRDIYGDGDQLLRPRARGRNELAPSPWYAKQPSTV
jgi:hypothetical protein